ncbi:hypothetical protein [Rhodococcus ruber]|uniref:hypothetical protein n=1 Tax=Rhodococcus ruber TaxID=1830 RepID=UPI0011AB6559|nr:hypothetical protein [Rhodococcus ruber]
MSNLHTDPHATATRLAAQLEQTEATVERLAGKLAAEEFRCHGWQSRALADEAHVDRRPRRPRRRPHPGAPPDGARRLSLAADKPWG